MMAMFLKALRSIYALRSWLGGSLVSAMSFVASHTLCIGPWFSFRVSLCLFSVGGPYYHGTQAVIMHELR